jgi:hypothetical protein
MFSKAYSRGERLLFGVHRSQSAQNVLHFVLHVGQSASRVEHIRSASPAPVGRAEIKKIRLPRSQGKSVRQLAKEFGASQWMIARLEPAA